MTERQARRTAWFNRGVHALGCVVTPRPSGYVCPLCLRMFTLEDLAGGRLSDEHVPPRSVGGMPLVLTCTECNWASGRWFDEKMADEEKLRTWGRPYSIGPIVGQVLINGLPLRASINFDGEKVEMIGHPGSNNPATVAAHTKALETLGDGDSIELKFPRIGTTRLSKLGWMRSAYLAAFAMFGYRYVLQPAFDPLRSALANPNDKSFTPVVRRGPDGALDPMIAEVTGPEALAGWRVVMFGPRAVFLPPWGAPADWYINLEVVLAQQEGDGIQVRSIASCRFPSEPLYLTDG